MSNKGVELGSVEVKPIKTSKALIQNDFCRIGEMYKRQIYLRMKAAKSVKEFKTFGILVAGKWYRILKKQLTTNPCILFFLY